MRISENVKVTLLAFVLVLCSFWLQGNIGINLADEGYLWYGAWRTLYGEIPMRDFQSYDPGRYYWTTAWAMIFGDGIMALRISLAIFQALGLTFGLMALRRTVHSWWGRLLAGLLLLIWMFPRHKLFEPSLAMAAIYFAVLIIENPTLRRHFAVGVFVGVAAFFGRNHGLYGFVSFLFLILFIWLKLERSHLFKRVVVWGVGILLGYSPMVFMLTFIPGFFQNFMQLVLFYFPTNPMGTRIHLPIPWPWTADFSGMNMLITTKSVSTGIFFLMLPAFYILSGVSLKWMKRDFLKKNASFIASVFVGIPYMHHAFDRADLSHLAQGIHPLLIGLFSLPFICKSTYWKAISMGLLAVVFLMSYFSVGMASPYYRKFIAPEGTFEQINIRGDTLWVHTYNANIIRTTMKIDGEKVLSDEGLLIAPHWPGLYPILQRKSPLWQVYFLRLASEKKQNRLITDLQKNNVHWVILGDIALDGRDDLRFRNTHSLLWQYLMENFEPVQIDGLPDNYRLLRKK